MLLPDLLLAVALVTSPQDRPAADPDSVAASGALQPIAAAIGAMIERERELKRIPAVSIAVVDRGRTVWARGFGLARPSVGEAATANTVYRIGSVSKLFTDIAILQLVERGTLDLDAPVTTYLPDFRPRNPFGGTITLRQLMAHRAGLVREPPVGNYFDSTDTVLGHMVESLNRTALVYAPGTRTKYSNAAIGTVGYVLERTQGRPFAAYLREAVLQPAGMTQSAFTPEPALVARLAEARMWTRHGVTFPAPTFQLGMAPAGSMYATVHDLARFMRLLLDRGAGEQGRVLQPATLESMWQPQAGGRFGLGFALGQLNGRRLVGHGGAIYGFATELLVLPDDSLGVVLTGSRDGVNAVLSRIGRTLLAAMLAERRGAPVTVPDSTRPVPAALGRALAGRYAAGRDTLTLAWRVTSGTRNPDANGLRRGTLFLTRTGADTRVAVRTGPGDTLVVDDAFEYGTPLLPSDSGVRYLGALYRHLPEVKPAPAPAALVPLLGEYGWDHNVLYLYEQDGGLRTLIEWFFDYPLTRVNDSTWRFPDTGLYAGESLVVRRGADGRVTEVEAAAVRFPRRAVGPEPGAPQLKIRPVAPVAALRAAGLAATPPEETGDFLPTDLVEVRRLDRSIRLDVRYATTNNFFGAVFYEQPRTFLQRPAAEALVRVHRALAADGLGLLLHDGYRPWYVTKMFWDGTPERFREFVANPASGSKHNRGAGIDLNLFDRRTGRPVEQVGTYDEFSERSYPEYPGGTSLQRWYRERLRAAMEAEGFLVTENEWWHFDFGEWRRYRIGNRRFRELDGR